MPEYIDKAEILAELDDALMAGVAIIDRDPRVFEIIRIFKRMVNDFPGADIQPVVDTENMATVSDEFICKKCGIYLKDYIKVVMDEDNDGYIDEQHYDYEPKFCPECGAKVKED